MTTNEEPDEAPPPYQEKPEQQNLNDDGKTDATATAAQPTGGDAKPVQQNEPPPDGEGEFGAPLKRLMWIGGCLLLWCILAFWLPVYNLDQWANYCDNYCEALGTSDPATCEAGCELAYDTLDETLKISQRVAAYALMVVGLIMIALGVVLGYFGVKQGNRLYCQITAGLLGLGGLLAIIGIILKIAVPEDPEEVVLAGLIYEFVEVAIPGSVAILLAYDVFNPLFLNVERNRWLYCTSAIFIVFGLMGGILNAYIANYETCIATGSSLVGTVCSDHPLKDEIGCIAAGYFILAIFCLIRILIFEGKINIDNPANMVTAKLLVAVLIVVGAFILAVGYWAYVDAAYEGASGDGVDQAKCWSIAFTLFVLGIAIINAIDMGIVALWKACQAAQATANAADGNAAT